MNVHFVKLYEHFGRMQPEGAVGELTCYRQHTPCGLSARRTRPAVLVIPGGGYCHVSEREAEPVALRFLARGYQAFVLKYAVAPAQFPMQLQEAAMAMAYIRENAAAFDVDPTMVAAVGFSAGGHLCGTLGTLFDSPEVAQIGDAALLRPDAMGLCYPVAVSWGPTHEGSFDALCGGDVGLRRRLSLDFLARKDMPPAYIWHTRDDESVPCRNSMILAQRMEEVGVPVCLRLHDHGHHGLSTADVQAYGSCRLPQVSPGIGDWPEDMMAYFAKLGFCVRDREEMA